LGRKGLLTEEVPKKGDEEKEKDKEGEGGEGEAIEIVR
jgi:hypothetical protein